MELLTVVIAIAAKRSRSCKRPGINPRLLRRFLRNDMFGVRNGSRHVIYEKFANRRTHPLTEFNSIGSPGFNPGNLPSRRNDSIKIHGRGPGLPIRRDKRHLGSGSIH